MKSRSVFRYKIINKHKSSKDIMEKLNEELNKGITFIISQASEKIIHLGGEWKGWATTTIHRDKINIYVDDKFFCKCVFEQILTSLWANLLDFGEIRLEDFKLSDNLHTFLTLRNINKQSSQKLLKINGPYFGIIFKPSYGLSLSDKLKITEKFANIGGTFIKEDETYFVEKSILLKESKVIQNAMNSVCDHCFYVPNTTHYVSDADLFRELCKVNIRIIMLNYLITGLPIVYKIANENNKLLFWGHRVGYKSIKRYISMRAMARLAAYSGINILHIGTPILSIDNSVKKCKNILKVINELNLEIIPVFTKISPQIISSLTRLYGKKIILMACGSIITKGYLDWGKLKNIIEILRALR